MREQAPSCMSKKRILVVDDDLACARILKAGLERTGRYDVRSESRAADALSAAREFGPDLVLLDVCMVDGDGGDVAFQLRHDDHLRHTPIVFMTSIVSREEARNSNAQHGAYDFLAKPVRLGDIVTCIEHHTGTGQPDPQRPLERKST
jgi:CheY-like chemotaxis protein